MNTSTSKKNATPPLLKLMDHTDIVRCLGEALGSEDHLPVVGFNRPRSIRSLRYLISCRPIPSQITNLLGTICNLSQHVCPSSTAADGFYVITADGIHHEFAGAGMPDAMHIFVTNVLGRIILGSRCSDDDVVLGVALHALEGAVRLAHLPEDVSLLWAPQSPDPSSDQPRSGKPGSARGGGAAFCELGK